MKERRVMYQKQRRQAGFVSLFSVLFFALLATVITVGFIRIMNTERRQALDNDLTQRALSAAEAGAEDAKRALIAYLKASGTDKTDLRAALTGPACNSLFSATTPAVKAVKLPVDGVIDGDQELSYRCLKVKLDTPDYVGTLSADESQMIPLRATGSYDRVQLKWHVISDAEDSETDGPADAMLNATNPSVPDFANSGENKGKEGQPPSFMRAQIVGVKKTGPIQIDDFNRRDFTVFGRPVVGAGGSGQNLVNIQTADSHTNNGINPTTQKSSPVPVDCYNASEAKTKPGEYACTLTLGMPSGAESSDSNEYFLKLTSIYRKSHFRLALQKFNGTTANPVNFSEVQPSIDSTGAAKDVLRRIETRVSLPGASALPPQYTAQIGNNLCKHFFVTSDENQFQKDATPGCETPN